MNPDLTQTSQHNGQSTRELVNRNSSPRQAPLPFIIEQLLLKWKVTKLICESQLVRRRPSSMQVQAITHSLPPPRRHLQLLLRHPIQPMNPLRHPIMNRSICCSLPQISSWSLRRHELPTLAPARYERLSDLAPPSHHLRPTRRMYSPPSVKPNRLSTLRFLMLTMSWQLLYRQRNTTN